MPIDYGPPTALMRGGLLAAGRWAPGTGPVVLEVASAAESDEIRNTLTRG